MAESIEAIAKKVGVSRTAAGDMVEAFTETAQGALKKGESVALIFLLLGRQPLEDIAVHLLTGSRAEAREAIVCPWSMREAVTAG